ncbi:peptide-methionine (S)-S-oxide reductase MsrA [Achromobacter piechaudii]|uniref:Peptide methionine sulfoxide reductase MsrA n=1 Tax=Achromobacter piechaudii TaxID=72556 RepID=A0ABN7F4F5_9BURK|nr:peptide-methionine (S)-S-oxide reductase MsrA [Achromobacter piechaudii]CAB3722411.1 Peptide methionine sulfoxide reductase MsrA [Achromobacter piechaudii]CAB3893603.1 Peptide methionine sulfoxide reductase MsrA [Achromobacter piechaudii]CAB3957500.1 Peptide methionine sulfoxide reductase MsrA [Achromobacter piechaudii]
MNFQAKTFCATLAAAFGLLGMGASNAAETAFIIPAPAVDQTPDAAGQEKAVIAGGCFWGVQAVFQHVKGVSNAVSGYAGGQATTANYDTVSNGSSGHAEAIEITYDPKQVTYGQLLQIYFSVAHDPTQLNRQGPDRGTQYRSAVFPANDGQRKVAEAYIAQLNKSGVYSKALATTVEPLKQFYPAEGYHQDYLVKHPNSMYIVINDVPKVENLAKTFPGMWRDKPVLVN